MMQVKEKISILNLQNKISKTEDMQHESNKLHILQISPTSAEFWSVHCNSDRVFTNFNAEHAKYATKNANYSAYSK